MFLETVNDSLLEAHWCTLSESDLSLILSAKMIHYKIIGSFLVRHHWAYGVERFYFLSILIPDSVLKHLSTLLALPLHVSEVPEKPFVSAWAVKDHFSAIPLNRPHISWHVGQIPRIVLKKREEIRPIMSNFHLLRDSEVNSLTSWTAPHLVHST